MIQCTPDNSGHAYSGHSDIVATSPGPKYIYSIIFRLDILANRT